MEPDAPRIPSESPGGPLPSGTVTFLFTDIEGSTELFHRLRDAYAEPLERHRRLVRAAVGEHGGVEVAVEGDGFFFAFAGASSAVQAAVAAQRALTAEPWPADCTVRVRMGVHTGDATAGEGGYVALAVHEAARVAAAAHGGQILVSDATVAAAAALRDDIGYRDLGRFRLKGFERPIALAQVTHPDISAAFPAPRAAAEARHNLPARFSTFVGRDQEQADIDALVDGARLVTLTGNGGGGKTSLAIRVAEAQVPKHADGVWFVDLAPITDPNFVAATAAGVLGVSAGAGRGVMDALTETIADRDLLLVMDNCEHLLPAAASFTQASLQACPRVRVLATSRERLAIDGERVYRVPSLSLPPTNGTARDELEGSDAFRLFRERAAAYGVHFDTDDELGAAVSICRRLDGIPLALELAAARLPALSVVELEHRLDTALRVLTSGARTAPGRQQTLRATIEWSYELLAPTDRNVLTWLSVFVGGFDLDTAETICASMSDDVPALDAVTALVDKSLVQRDGGAPGRYRLLETVREFASERLDARGADVRHTVHVAHRDAFVALAERAAPELCGPAQQVWFDRLEREHDNLRAALAFCNSEADGIDEGTRLALALFQFWKHARTAQEGAAAMTAVLARMTPDVAPVRRARALLACTWLSLWCGQNREANARLGAALEVIQGLHEPALEAEAAVAQSQLALMEGSYDTSVAAAQRAVELLAAADGSAWLWHMAYGARGAAHGERGEYDQARADLAIAVRVDREAGSGWDAATALVTLAWTEIMTSDIDAARVRLQEAFMLGRSESAHLTLAAAEIALRDGDIDGAEELCVSALERASRGGDHEHTPYFLLTLASCAARRGASERAAQLYGASQRSLEQRGEATTPFDADRRREEVPALRAHLGDEAYEAAYERGRSLTPADAFAFALARE